jgi:hypothetical protein
MKTIQNESSTTVYPFIRACTASCKKLVAKIQSIKKSLLTEFHYGVDDHRRLFQLALNEAEALAHETGFPLLVFPTLAREKAEEVAEWTRRQQAVRRSALVRLAA